MRERATLNPSSRRELRVNARTTIALGLALVARAAACGSDEEQDDGAGGATTVTETDACADVRQ
jgi:hypothetical protein